jgi:hypothetical protein
LLYFKELLSKFWCNLDKRIFEKQFKNKGEIKKSANGWLQLKSQNGEGLNSKILIATVASYSTELAPPPKIRKWWWWSRAIKIHILYTVGKSTKRRTQRDDELAKWLSSLGENWRGSFRSKNKIEQSEPWLIKLTLQTPSPW